MSDLNEDQMNNDNLLDHKLNDEIIDKRSDKRNYKLTDDKNIYETADQKLKSNLGRTDDAIINEIHNEFDIKRENTLSIKTEHNELKSIDPIDKLSDRSSNENYLNDDEIDNQIADAEHMSEYEEDLDDEDNLNQNLNSDHQIKENKTKLNERNQFDRQSDRHFDRSDNQTQNDQNEDKKFINSMNLNQMNLSQESRLEPPNQFNSSLNQSNHQTVVSQIKNDSQGDKELVDKLRTELSRLKEHLIQIEEDYTNELVEVQQREQKLEEQLIKANNEIEQLNHRLNNTGPLIAIRAQAEQALDERDQVLQRCSKLEDEVQRSQASLANLQLVIERMQKEHDQRLQTINKLHEQNLIEERCRYSQLENEINKYQLKLQESNNALQAAARLSQQLHSKQETIDQLRTHLQKKEELVNRLHDEINDLNASCEGKVDKQFIKNLVVGYFNAESDKKQDVARLLARILDFNEQEMRKAGIQLNLSNTSSFDQHGHHRRQNSSSSTTSSSYGQSQSDWRQDESIAQQFVHFLEEESKVHKLPVAMKLAHDLTKAVVPEQQIKTTNLISKPVITSYTTVNNQIVNSASSTSKIESNIDSTNLPADQTQPEVKPMLIPNSAIMNAQLSKLSSFNSKQSAIINSQTPSQLSSNNVPFQNPLNQQTSNDNQTIKPVLLNIVTNNPDK